GFHLSPQQRRAWALLSSGKNVYGVRGKVVVNEPLDIQMLQTGLGDVVRRHEILRTEFHALPGMLVPLQVINSSQSFDFKTYDLKNLNAGEQQIEIDNHLENDCSEMMGQSGGSLLKVVHARLSVSKHVLIVTLPSFACDQRGLEILLVDII